MVGVTDPKTGKFVKGNKAGGRKKRLTEDRYLQVFKDAVSETDWKEIVTKAVIDAKRGDGVARKFIADYIIGPPVQRNEHTGADGGAIKTDNTIAIKGADYRTVAAILAPGSIPDSDTPGESQNPVDGKTLG